MSQFEPPKPAINFPNGIQHKEHPVTNHMTAAIEAAALQQFCLEKKVVTNQHERWNNLSRDQRSNYLINATMILGAGIPHLRAMIAQEIMDQLLPNDKSPEAEWVRNRVTQIAKGPQQ